MSGMDWLTQDWATASSASDLSATPRTNILLQWWPPVVGCRRAAATAGAARPIPAPTRRALATSIGVPARGRQIEFPELMRPVRSSLATFALTATASRYTFLMQPGSFETPSRVAWQCEEKRRTWPGVGNRPQAAAV